MKIHLYLDDSEKDIGEQLVAVGQQYGMETVIVSNATITEDVPKIAIISERIQGEPGMIMQGLSNNGVQTYLLSRQSGLAIFNSVKEKGGKGIIPVLNAAEEFNLICGNMGGINNLKAQVNRRQPLRAPLREAHPVSNPYINTPSATVTSSITLGNTVVAQPAVTAPTHPLQTTPYVLNNEVICVYAFKGGVGKSTVAANLALELASIQQPKQSVVLVDFDINSAGRLTSLLNVNASTTILDWVATKYIEDISNYLVDGPGGIKILPAPRLPHDERAVTREVAEKVIQTLSRRFDVVVIDTPMILRDSTILALDLATRIFLLSTLDRPTLQGVYQVSQTFKNLNIDPNKVRLVLNRVPKRSSIRIDDFKEVIPYSLLASLPEDQAVQTSVNRCEMPALDRKAKAFLSGMHKIVGSIVPTFHAESSQPKVSILNKIPFFKRR